MTVEEKTAFTKGAEAQRKLIRDNLIEFAERANHVLPGDKEIQMALLGAIAVAGLSRADSDD